ncbi:MAG: DUF1957 domain-containing protein [Deltaproteobacteria bacterium]|nr:DUF1957 domain-containing protein [Deltaproteobacteria bacterium]
MKSHLLFVLHGHLPWVNHPEHEFFLEEDWLFEAIADCYLPLLKMFDGWRDDEIEASFTLGLSPPLLHMLGHDGLRERAVRALNARISLIERTLAGFPDDSPYRAALFFSREEAEEGLARYESLGRDIVKGLAEHQKDGRVELMTCGATHGLMPVLLDDASIRAQIIEAKNTHERFVGTAPRGIWLPECGVTHMSFGRLAEEEMVFTFCEDRALRFASPPPQAGPYRPLYSPEGVAFFARDPVAAKEVWSAEEGYPGDFRYREFYRDLGYDAEESQLSDEHKQGTGARKQVGVKLHRITGKVSLDEKKPYDPHAAMEAVKEHAAHFVQRRIEQAAALEESFGLDPCFTCSFDAELFGHWWHEGPRFLDECVRQLLQRQEEGAPKPTNAFSYLEAEPRQQVSVPAVSSWGDEGAFKVWVNPSNDWLWRKVHDATLRLKAAASAPPTAPDLTRALQQATREVLLAQSSDWPFILTNETQTGYGVKRPLVHLSRAHRLLDMLDAGEVNEADLAQLEERDAVFENVDVSIFAE